MTKKKNNFLSALKDAAKIDHSIIENKKKFYTNTPPSRIGKKAITGFFDPSVSTQLKILSAEKETSIQSLLTEALNDFFIKNGKSPLA